jgi:hypothetical protein
MRSADGEAIQQPLAMLQACLLGKPCELRICAYDCTCQKIVPIVVWSALTPEKVYRLFLIERVSV